MMIRILIFLIPLLTFVIPERWFAFYASIIAGVVAFIVLMLTLLREQTNQAFTSFGVEMVLGYLAVNLVLLGARYWLIRRARERILKLPAPKAKDE
jgi:lipopolysaccharide export LptBFGC system permease protein LptF